MKLQLTVLTTQELKSRYESERLKNTRMARDTKMAITAGYSIGVLEYLGLEFDSPRDWIRYTHDVIAARFKGKLYKIGGFTDLSEWDKIYFSFKTKDGVKFAHSCPGCDSEGFILF